MNVETLDKGIKLRGEGTRAKDRLTLISQIITEKPSKGVTFRLSSRSVGVDLVLTPSEEDTLLTLIHSFAEKQLKQIVREFEELKCE